MLSTRFWEVYLLVFAFVFILPTLIGAIRGVHGLGTVILLNILALVSFGVGWIAAMGFACFWEGRARREPRIRIPEVPKPRHDYDPGPLRGTPFEPLARSEQWAQRIRAMSNKR